MQKYAGPNSLQEVANVVNSRIKTFHASIDNSSFQYIKGSADFTYQDAISSENCQVEIQIANENLYLQKLEHKNINPPDPIAGRYVGFCGMMRIAGEMGEVFLFIYDDDNLPTDAGSVARLETWGDYTYCQSSYQPVVMKNFLKQDVNLDRANTNDVASIKAVGDYTDEKCGVVLDYVQTTFAENLINLMEDKYGAHEIYDCGTEPGLLAHNSGETGTITWDLEGLDLTPYKRIKAYIAPSTDTGVGFNRLTSSMVIELYLDERSKLLVSSGHYLATLVGYNVNDRNTQFQVAIMVSANKTKFSFIDESSIYGTTVGGRQDNGRYLYRIEAYKT